MLVTSNILDTLRLDKTGFFLKEPHALRTFEAYQLLAKDVYFETVTKAYNEIEQQLLQTYKDQLKVRLIFDKDIFSYKIHYEQLEEISLPVKLQLLEKTAENASPFSAYKWEDRSGWNRLLLSRNPLADDILVTNKSGYVTETSRFNILVYSAKEQIAFTPTLASGCLNGVYRRYLIGNGHVELPGIGLKPILEIDLTKSDLQKAKIFLINSVRKILPAQLISQ